MMASVKFLQNCLSSENAPESTTCEQQQNGGAQKPRHVTTGNDY
jgi:hypothetical protein